MSDLLESVLKERRRRMSEIRQCLRYVLCAAWTADECEGAIRLAFVCGAIDADGRDVLLKNRDTILQRERARLRRKYATKKEVYCTYHAEGHPPEDIQVIDDADQCKACIATIESNGFIND